MSSSIAKLLIVTSSRYRALEGDSQLLLLPHLHGGRD